MKKLLLIVSLVFALGCSEQKVEEKVNDKLCYRETSASYEIQSYQPITEDQKEKVKTAFEYAMKEMEQEKLKRKFLVKIFYNQIAFNVYCGRPAFDLSTAASTFTGRNPIEVVIPLTQFDIPTLLHEIVHAIEASNNLVLSDSESLPEFLEDKYVLDNISDVPGPITFDFDYKNPTIFVWEPEKEVGEFKRTVRLEFPREQIGEDDSTSMGVSFTIPKGTKLYIED